MGLKTGIEWCDSTVNPSTGCDGCELWNGRDIRVCYAGNLHEARLAKSLPALYAENFQEVRLAPGRMMEAARWPDLRGKERPDKPWLNGLPRMIFVGDMGDFGSRDVPDDYFIDEIIGAIRSTAGARHFWLLLTKQISRLAKLSVKIGGLPDQLHGPHNDHVSAHCGGEDSGAAQRRVPLARHQRRAAPGAGRPDGAGQGTVLRVLPRSLGALVLRSCDRLGHRRRRERGGREADVAGVDQGHRGTVRRCECALLREAARRGLGEAGKRVG